jgi:hypothetical protein
MHRCCGSVLAPKRVRIAAAAFLVGLFQRSRASELTRPATAASELPAPLVGAEHLLQAVNAERAPGQRVNGGVAKGRELLLLLLGAWRRRLQRR